MSKFKLSFSKHSAVDILSAVLILAIVVLGFFNYFGLNITSEQVEDLIKSVGLILGFFGLILNTNSDTYTASKLNVSSESVSEALKLGQELASVAVPELAVNSGLTKRERKNAGISQVSSKLNQLGHHLDLDTIAGLVERAYQLYKASGGTSVDTTVTPMPTDEDEGGGEDE